MKCTRPLPVLIAPLLLAALPPSTRAGETGFPEKFALAEDREAVLKELIPGTVEYFYYHALHYQNQGRKPELEAILQQWNSRFPGRHPWRTEIENRRALLDYAANPGGTLAYLRENLGIGYGHQRITPDARPDLATRLDPELISWDRFLAAALTGTDAFPNLTPQGLVSVLKTGKPELTVPRRRDLLNRIHRPDFPGLPAIINDDLGTPESRGFGEFPIHGKLTLAQLGELLKLRPDLLGNSNFVTAWAARLGPAFGEDAERSAAVREAWLDRLEAFTAPLVPAFNSLKAHVLYQRLVHDAGRGVIHEPRLLEYLKLPRPVAYVHPEWAKSDAFKNPADLNADFAALSGGKPVGNDEALVRRLLLTVLAGDSDAEKYAPYLNDQWLKALHAEAKLLSGAPEAQKWVSLLPPESYQALKDRVDLDFDAAARQEWNPGDSVSLDLYVKNVPKLLVKVYEINTGNVHRTTGAQVNTDLNLDGLTANSEQIHDFASPPLIRARRTFSFPELKGKRGVWIVEFIGGGKSSRALIRKGGLRPLVKHTEAGTLLTVLDESLKPVAKAHAMLGTRRFEAGEDGGILIPFSQQSGDQDIIIGDSTGFTTLEKVNLAAENYALKAGFHVPRESLLPGRTARVAIRPALLMSGRPAALGVLEKVRLTIASLTLDGVPASAVYELGQKDREGKPSGPQLSEDAETVVEFAVPERLGGLSFNMEAEVKSLATGQKVRLTAADALHVNGITITDQVSDLHLTPSGGQFILEERGRTGELRADREVVITVTRPDFTNTVELTLKTDASGAIALGSLEGIAAITARSASGLQRTFSLPRTWASLPQAVNIKAGEDVQLAWRGPGEPSAGGVSVLELRNGSPVRDAAAAVKPGKGIITLSGLAPGEYAVEMGTPDSSTIVRVGGGETVSGNLIGGSLVMELSNPAPLSIQGMDRIAASAVPGQKAGSAMVFHIGNPGRDTRVHLVASRFLPAFDIFAALGDDRLPQPGAWITPFRPSLYQSARTIGEEYRYVLDRRNAKHYPGNLLPRPGLLLNPWAISDTRTEKQLAAAGEDAAAMAAERPGAAAPPAPEDLKAKKEAAPPAPMDPDLSFLARQGEALFNLRPDQDGNVAVDARWAGDRQFVRVIAVDSDSAAVRDFPVAPEGLKLRDLRLADGLDPAQHYSRQDRMTLLEKDVPFEFKDALTATWQNVGNLSDAHALLFNLSGNATLAEFSWILEWPDLAPARKAELYSKYASHELHFFLEHKDPEFFKRVVLPFLSSKRDKTFMDHFLLGADLSAYLRPWEYGRLNTVERILLARRMEKERPVVRRDLKDALDLLPKNPQRDAFLFETALNGRALLPSSGVTVTGKASADSFGFNGASYFSRQAGFGGGRGEGGERFDTDQLGRRMLGDQPQNAPAGAMAAPAAPAAADAVKDRASLMLAEELEKDADGAALGAAVDEAAKSERKRDGKPVASRFALRGVNPEKAGKAIEARRKAADKLDVLFRQMDQTREWAENNYYHLLIAAQTADLVNPNRFWLDYAGWDGTSAFLSTHLAETGGTFTEMLLALAVLDVPFQSQAKAGKVDRRENTVTLTPAGQGILFHQEIRAAEADRDGTPLLVSQNFYRHGDRYTEQAGEKTDKFVSAEFLTGVVYGCQVVVTNPSSARQKLDLLFQIPQGAIPVLTTQATRSLPVALEPYHTETFDFQFYFPAPGKFPHYPVHLSRNAKTAASAAAFTFNVVARPTMADKASWEYVSQNSEPEGVLAFLEQNNLKALNLDLMAWRLGDAGFCKKAIALLRSRHHFHATTWSYALNHDIPEAVSDYLLHRDDFLAKCPPVLETPLLRVDPVVRGTYQHLEYSPLVNARAHQLGARRTILNDKQRAQFDALIRILTFRPALNPEEQLAVAWHLALQDRMEEAIAAFAKVDPAQIAEKLQVDYLQAWLALSQEDTATARRIATAHAGDAVDHWRQKFAELASQLDEIDGKTAAKPKDDDRDAVQDRLAAAEPACAVRIENKTVTLDYHNLTEVTVNYYPMDLEFLFSANPFVTQDTGRFRVIRPNKSEKVALPAGKDSLSFALPKEYRSTNVLVEVSGGGLTKAEASYANELDVQISEGFGRLQVSHSGDRRPLSRVYVKVFAEQNGVPVFYKDGYTDLRGKFDYASLSTGDLDSTTRFSILILSEQHGATVKEVQPPRR